MATNAKKSAPRKGGKKSVETPEQELQRHRKAYDDALAKVKADPGPLDTKLPPDVYDTAIELIDLICLFDQTVMRGGSVEFSGPKYIRQANRIVCLTRHLNALLAAMSEDELLSLKAANGFQPAEIAGMVDTSHLMLTIGLAGVRVFDVISVEDFLSDLDHGFCFSFRPRALLWSWKSISDRVARHPLTITDRDRICVGLELEQDRSRLARKSKTAPPQQAVKVGEDDDGKDRLIEPDLVRINGVEHRVAGPQLARAWKVLKFFFHRKTHATFEDLVEAGVASDGVSHGAIHGALSEFRKFAPTAALGWTLTARDGIVFKNFGIREE